MPISTTCPHQPYCEMREQTDMRFISHLTRNTFAIILAGGRGSRLKQLTDFRSKPAVPFGGKFRIIDFTLSNCVNSGIRKIGVATQYKAHSLIRHIQRGWSFLDGRFDEFIQLLPAQQQIDETSGTRAPPTPCSRTSPDPAPLRPKHVLVVAGDHIYKMDYGRMLAEHAKHQADMSVACIDVPLAEASANSA
jgi:glucose-1-phosphate adenylyltransferase